MFNPFNFARPESTLSNNGTYEATDEELQEYNDWKYENENLYFPEGRDEVDFEEIEEFFGDSDDDQPDDPQDGFGIHQWDDGDYFDED